MSGASAWSDGFIAGIYWLPIAFRVMFVWGRNQAEMETWDAR